MKVNYFLASKEVIGKRVRLEITIKDYHCLIKGYEVILRSLKGQTVK